MTNPRTIPFVGDMADDTRSAWLHHLQSALPGFEIVPLDHASSTSKAEVAFVANPDPDVLAKMPNLRWVQSLWAGVENMTHRLPDDIAIVRMTDPQLAKTMAEAVLTATLFLHRDFPGYAKQQAAAEWKQRALVLPRDRKVGVLGLGALGQEACAALTRHGFDVLGWSRSEKAIPNVRCSTGEHGLSELLSTADITVILLPSTPATAGLLDRARLSSMKEGAALINFARADIVDTDSLIDLLGAGALSHAVLDVFDAEPLPPHHPLWRLPNVTLLPHVAAPTNMRTASDIAAQNILAFFETGALPPSVDRRQGY